MTALETPRLMTQHEIVDWLQQNPERIGYRYALRGGMVLFTLLAGIGSVVLAILLGLRTGLDTLLLQTTATVLGLAGIFAWWQIFHQWLFTVRAYAMFGEDALLVGRGHYAWSIPYASLRRDTVMLKDVRTGVYSWALPIEVEGVRVTTKLENALMHMKNQQIFVVTVLKIVVQNDPDAPDADVEDDVEDDAADSAQAETV